MGPEDNPHPLNPELVEEHYEIAVGVLKAFASSTSDFTLRELRAHFDENNISTPAAKDEFQELIDEMRGDIVQEYAQHEPPVEVGWLAYANERGQKQYTLGVVERSPEGRRRLQSPVAVVLKHTVGRPAIPQTQPEEITAVSPTAPGEAAEPGVESDFTFQERKALEAIVVGINMHRNRVMRPHWIEESLAKLGHEPEAVHRILRKAEDLGILFTATRKSQLYYTTVKPHEAETAAPQAPREERRRKHERPLTDNELDVVEDILNSLAGSLEHDPRPQLLRQLVSKYQGKVSKPGMRHLLRALEDRQLIATFVAQGVRQNAAQQVKIQSDARQAWLRDREAAWQAIRGLRVKA